MARQDHKLSLCKQCELLQLSRSRLYYQPVGESAENLRFMENTDKQFLETPWYGSRYMKRNTPPVSGKLSAALLFSIFQVGGIG